ncbi:MAG TPA: surface-adhesin E family protein [Burkholderiales bacterium]|jgi:hypothetical protein
MRVVLTLLLILTAAPAWADWVKVGEASKTVFYVLSANTDYYIDPSTITKDGNIRKVWEILDLSDKGPHGERSILVSVEFDCLQKLMRMSNATGHSHPMASGEIIKLSQLPDDWIILRPGKEDAIFFKILNAVCAP